MNNDTTKIWLDILQILVPALAVVITGSIGYWKYLKEEERKRALDEATKDQGQSNIKIRVEEAVWTKVQQTIEAQAFRLDEQDKKMEHQDAKIVELEGKFSLCDEERLLLKKQNKLLLEEKDTLKRLVEELMQRLNGDNA